MKKINKKKIVVVAMSGGVDSSTAAMLLKDSGFKVLGMYMRLGISGEENNETAVRAICRKLSIDFYPINLEEVFKKEVKDYFINSYKKGITPNPCVKCNKLIKFGELLNRAKDLGAGYLATGHYISKQTTEYSKQITEYKLFRGEDRGKDQSYFLYTLTQEQLKRVIFPLGEYTKEDARALADEAGLPYIKSESQDVCFLKHDGKILEHNEYLKEYIKLKPGPIKLIILPHPSHQQGVGAIFNSKQEKSVPSPYQGGGQGEVIGEHQGLPLYTIGQRRGVEIGGTGPYYVAKTDYSTNTLYVVDSHDHSALFKDELIAGEVNWISGSEPELPLKCEAVIRYGHKAVECAVKRSDRFKSGPTAYQVKFKKPQRAITPGQSVVFYKVDEVLGGGSIKD